MKTRQTLQGFCFYDSISLNGASLIQFRELSFINCLIEFFNPLVFGGHLFVPVLSYDEVNTFFTRQTNSVEGMQQLGRKEEKRKNKGISLFLYAMKWHNSVKRVPVLWWVHLNCPSAWQQGHYWIGHISCKRPQASHIEPVISLRLKGNLISWEKCPIGNFTKFLGGKSMPVCLFFEYFMQMCWCICTWVGK